MPPRLKKTPIREVVLKLRKLKDDKSEIEKEIKGDKKAGTAGVEQLVIDHLKAQGAKTVTVQGDGDESVTATLVAGQSEVIDAALLKSRLTPGEWEAITEQVINNDLLKDAMAKGLIDPMVVAACSTTVDKSPYIRVTTSKTRPVTAGGVTSIREKSEAASLVTEDDLQPTSDATTPLGINKNRIRRKRSIAP